MNDDLRSQLLEGYKQSRKTKKRLPSIRSRAMRARDGLGRLSAIC